MYKNTVKSQLAQLSHSRSEVWCPFHIPAIAVSKKPHT